MCRIVILVLMFTVMTLSNPPSTFGAQFTKFLVNEWACCFTHCSCMQQETCQWMWHVFLFFFLYQIISCFPYGIFSGWHICSSCQKASHYMCYTCPYSLCKGCTRDADYLCVRQNKGFCGTCMRTIMLIENIATWNQEKVCQLLDAISYSSF